MKTIEHPDGTVEHTGTPEELAAFERAKKDAAKKDAAKKAPSESAPFRMVTPPPQLLTERQALPGERIVQALRDL